MTIPKEALDAAVNSAAKVLFCMQHRLPEKAFTTAIYRDLADAAAREATNALTAALPHLREQIAQEIEAATAKQLARPYGGLAENTVRVIETVRANTARIVRGEP